MAGVRERLHDHHRASEGLVLAGIVALIAGIGFVPDIFFGGIFPEAAKLTELLAGSRTVTVGLVALGSTLAVLVAYPPSRRRLAVVLHAFLVSRRWKRALAVVDVEQFKGGMPRVRHVSRVPAGESLQVLVPKGGRAADLENAAEAIASTLGIRDVRVQRDPAVASRAWVTLVYRDPLAGSEPLVWPHVGAAELSLWAPIPVGRDENGGLITMALPERNLLLGGEPGAGKSAALSLVVATAALDPTVKLWLFDGKLVELAGWARCAERSVGVDVEEAIEVLRLLQSEMENRYRTLLANRRRKVESGDDLALHVVVVDELAHYLNASDRKQRAEVAEVLRDLVSRGRAAGLIVIGATQKPSADVIPTALRDLFGFRWALRCSTPQASDTILGAGWASSGYSAAEVDAACRGVGYLLHEGGQPVRLRAFYLGDEDLAAIADRAEALRAQATVPTLRAVEG